jgi:hypothetical protein
MLPAMLTGKRLKVLTAVVVSGLVFLAILTNALRNHPELILLIPEPLRPRDKIEPVGEEYHGQTRAAILTRLGPPTHEWNGHYGNPPLGYVDAHSPAISMIYERPFGRLYLSFEQVDGEWICFSSSWLEPGAAF